MPETSTSSAPPVARISARLRSVVVRIRVGTGVLISRDNWRTQSQCEVLLACHANDLISDASGGLYSTVLEDLERHFLDRKVAFHRLLLPFSYPPRVLKTRFVICNRLLLLSRVLSRLSTRFRTFRFLYILYSRLELRAWARLLNSLAPKAIVAVGAPPMLCRACRLLGVLYVEILHGYRFTEVPWGYDRRKADELPDYIVCLDPVSSRTFSALEPSTKIISCRSSLETRRLKSLDTGRSVLQESSDLISSAYVQRSPYLIGRDSQTTVLVALQWGYLADEVFGGRFENGLYPSILDEQFQRRGTSLRFVLRLHPVHLAVPSYARTVAHVRRICSECRNVLDFQHGHGDLFRVFSYVDCVLTPGSGLASEALTFGLPVMFYDTSDDVAGPIRIAYQEEISSGIVSFWEIGEDLEERLTALVRSKRSAQNASNNSARLRIPSVPEALATILGQDCGVS